MFTNLKPIYTDALSHELNELYKLCKEKGYKEYPDSKEYTQAESYGVYKKHAEGYGVYKTPTQEYLVPLYSECTIDPITMENGVPTLNIGSTLAEYSTKHGFVSTFGNDSLFVIKD